MTSYMDGPFCDLCITTSCHYFGSPMAVVVHRLHNNTDIFFFEFSYFKTVFLKRRVLNLGRQNLCIGSIIANRVRVTKSCFIVVLYFILFSGSPTTKRCEPLLLKDLNCFNCNVPVF